MGRVSGKVAIVTGAAQGLGQASAELLAREGASVVLADVKEAQGEAVAAGIRSAGGTARFLRLDVASESEWQGVVDETVSAYGGLHVLVNNAAIALQKNVLDTSLEEWRQTMAVNLDGVFLGTKAAIPVMSESGGGSIVNLSSAAGLVAAPGLAAYSASKGGVRLLTKSVAAYCGRAGLKVRVNSIHPAFVRTALLDELLAVQEDPEAMMRGIMRSMPIGFMGEPIDIAYGVLYLASDESRWVTGTELVLDGGYTCV